MVKVGDQLFSFLRDLVERAATDFNSVNVLQGKSPDTSLLRAFVKLQGIQQEQLNGISQKHLQFYYRDILKQQQKNAIADRAIINVKLSSENSTFELPAGTLFKAGSDAEKNPVFFKSLKDTNLNPGSITGGFTLMQYSGASNNSVSLYKAPVVKPNILKKDKAGKVLGWETFGGNPNLTNQPESLGFAFASPMLYLIEGTRVLTITLNVSATCSTSV